MMTNTLATQKDRLLALLRQYAFAEREVTLSSGKKSNFYIDCKQVTLDAEGHVLIGQLLAAKLAEVAPSVTAVGGLTMGADPIASAIATMSFLGGRPLHAFYVRKEAKGHGTGQWLERAARIAPGCDVAVVEDVVTTGAASITAVQRVAEAGFRVACVLTIVDRMEGGREAIEAYAPLHALFRRTDFLAK